MIIEVKMPTWKVRLCFALGLFSLALLFILSMPESVCHGQTWIRGTVSASSVCTAEYDVRSIPVAMLQFFFGAFAIFSGAASGAFFVSSYLRWDENVDRRR